MQVGTIVHLHSPAFRTRAAIVTGVFDDDTVDLWLPPMRTEPACSMLGVCRENTGREGDVAYFCDVPKDSDSAGRAESANTSCAFRAQCAERLARRDTDDGDDF